LDFYESAGATELDISNKIVINENKDGLETKNVIAGKRVET
jgi:hypothetical protein